MFYGSVLACVCLSVCLLFPVHAGKQGKGHLGKKGNLFKKGKSYGVLIRRSDYIKTPTALGNGSLKKISKIPGFFFLRAGM